MFKFRKKLWHRENKKCFYCGTPTRLRLKNNILRKDIKGISKAIPDLATIDHIITKFEKGHQTFENCVSACYICNAERGIMDAEEFLFSKWMEIKVNGDF